MTRLSERIAAMTGPATPDHYMLLTQRIDLTLEEGLARPEDENDPASKPVDLNGVYQPAAGRVILDAALGPDVMREVAIHEALHSILRVGSLDKLMPEGLDEHACTVLAPVLLSFIRENPTFIYWCMGTGREAA